MIFEVGTNAKLQWNLTGVPNEKNIFNIIFTNKDNKEVTVAYIQIYSHTDSIKLTYYKNNNPFDKSRVDGYLNLIDGNGTVTFELKNIQYNESGVFYLEIFKNEKLGVTVDVQGKKNILDYFDVEVNNQLCYLLQQAFTKISFLNLG